MRPILAILTFLLAPTALGAQGRIIVPCPRPECRERICPPPPPCPGRPIGDAWIERTASDVRVELADGVLRYEVEERFVNRGGRIGEADYLFPLPRDAAFQDLKLSIDGEMIAGEVLGAAEARRIYEEIVRRQRDPALVEWMGRGLLRTRIFPIQPGEERRVIVRFQAVAQREGDAIRIDWFQGTPPGGGSVAPRELAGVRGTRSDDGSRTERMGGARASFTFLYPGDARYGRPYSPTHAVDVDDARGRKRVRVRGDAHEVTLLLPVRRGEDASISVLTHAPGRGAGFALITLSPPELRRRATERDITFVLDVSGSMSGKKMEQAREAGRQFLATLEPGDRFRMIDFSSDVRTFRDEWVAATPGNLRAAERYVESLRAEGGTNIAGALEEALRIDRSTERLPLVLFITDGAPTVGERDPATIAAMAKRLRRDARVFTFGLGADVNVALVEQLALEGRGAAHFVRPEESVERTVSIAASRLASPVATDVRVRAEGVRLVQSHPAETMDLFAGQDVVVLTRYEGSGTGRITFEGRSAAGPIRWSVPVRWEARERDNGFIARLWATQRVGWLSAERRRNGPSQELDAEIRELGERYGIPTELTSYFVREPGMVAQDLVGRGQGGVGRASVQAQSAPAVAREEQFAAARAASDQRRVANIATADSIAAASVYLGENTAAEPGGDGRSRLPMARRTIDGRTLVLRDSVWTDASLRAGTHRLKIAPFSEAWFGVLELLPELRAAFMLGDRVVVAGRSLAIEVASGGVERLGSSERRMIERDW